MLVKCCYQVPQLTYVRYSQMVAATFDRMSSLVTFDFALKSSPCVLKCLLKTMVPCPFSEGRQAE